MPKLSTLVITDQTVHSARPGARRYEIRDARLRGFMLRINPSGTKSWYVQLNRNRKRKIADATVLSATIARYRARDLLAQSARLTSGGPGGQTVGEFLAGDYNRWSSERSPFGRRDALRLKSALGPLAAERLDQLGLSHLEHWKRQRRKQVSEATFRRELAALKAALERAIDWNLIAENPARRVVLSESRPLLAVAILSAGERARLAAQLRKRNDRISLMTRLALNTGLSRGELFRLRWRDVQLGARPLIEVRNGRKHRNRSRKVPLSASTAEALQNWKAAGGRHSALVFPNPSGGALKSIQSAWTSLLKTAGVGPFPFRACRNDFGARLVAAGTPLARVRDLLGHSTITLTERYAEFSPQPREDLAERISID